MVDDLDNDKFEEETFSIETTLIHKIFKIQDIQHLTSHSCEINLSFWFLVNYLYEILELMN
jgi:hypothetical protein